MKLIDSTKYNKRMLLQVEEWILNNRHSNLRLEKVIHFAYISVNTRNFLLRVSWSNAASVFACIHANVTHDAHRHVWLVHCGCHNHALIFTFFNPINHFCSDIFIKSFSTWSHDAVLISLFFVGGGKIVSIAGNILSICWFYFWPNKCFNWMF